MAVHPSICASSPLPPPVPTFTLISPAWEAYASAFLSYSPYPLIPTWLLNPPNTCWCSLLYLSSLPPILRWPTTLSGALWWVGGRTHVPPTPFPLPCLGQSLEGGRVAMIGQWIQSWPKSWTLLTHRHSWLTACTQIDSWPQQTAGHA